VRGLAGGRTRPRRVGDLDPALRRGRDRARRDRGHRGGGGHRPSPPAAPRVSMAIPEYGTLDGLALAELVRRGEITPAELLEEAIARAERINPRINAIIAPMYEQARRDAAVLPAGGAFRGVPFLLKDLDAALAGMPLTAGC